MAPRGGLTRQGTSNSRRRGPVAGKKGVKLPGRSASDRKCRKPKRKNGATAAAEGSRGSSGRRTKMKMDLAPRESRRRLRKKGIKVDAHEEVQPLALPASDQKKQRFKRGLNSAALGSGSSQLGGSSKSGVDDSMPKESKTLVFRKNGEMEFCTNQIPLIVPSTMMESASSLTDDGIRTSGGMQQGEQVVVVAGKELPLGRNIVDTQEHEQTDERRNRCCDTMTDDKENSKASSGEDLSKTADGEDVHSRRSKRKLWRDSRKKKSRKASSDDDDDDKIPPQPPSRSIAFGDVVDRPPRNLRLQMSKKLAMAKSKHDRAERSEKSGERGTVCAAYAAMKLQRSRKQQVIKLGGTTRMEAKHRFVKQGRHSAGLREAMQVSDTLGSKGSVWVARGGEIF